MEMLADYSIALLVRDFRIAVQVRVRLILAATLETILVQVVQILAVVVHLVVLLVVQVGVLLR